ncbi:MAG: HAMP domain-containing histidine kinase [Nitrospira sp.]|nr:HAMP domain-containing histidine kinase [bacterium]MBL7047925.1 HAMP domain-containing histidine kinase [Nitrospira sp.]
MINPTKTIDFPAFLASTVHDMKNSLGMLMNTLDEVVETCVSKGCDSGSQLSLMQYESRRVNNNLIQLLTLYKMDMDQFSLQLGEYDVYELFEEIILQNDSVLKARGIELIMECDEQQIWFFDRELITGVINNVVNNAYRYAKEKILIRAVEEDGFIVISIADDGNGYPDAFLTTDVQQSTGVSFSTGSTGLGLYFASMVAVMHKNRDRTGTIEIANGGEYGGGCFTIRLP